jgi:arylsulfatase A-like enzyme
MVSSVDAAVGRILTTLEISGRLEDTIIVYTADHGIALGQHGLMGKQNLYDHSVRVPMILSGPGVRGGTRSDALVHSWDLLPTLCGLAGIGTPSGLDARSFAHLLRGEGTAHRTEVAALYRDFQRMIKDDRWKLIEYAVGGARHTQLFDLAADPWERNNLAGDGAASGELASLRQRLVRWQADVGDRFTLAS